MNEMGLEGQEGKEGPGRAFPAGPAATAGRDTVRRLSVAGPWQFGQNGQNPDSSPNSGAFPAQEAVGQRWTIWTKPSLA
jgi:hypothetical protein